MLDYNNRITTCKIEFGNSSQTPRCFSQCNLPTTFQLQVKNLLTDYKHVFACNYKKLKGILRKICGHKIQLMVDAQLIK
jgi:hypothetical protein